MEDRQLLDDVRTLRRELHEIPERSGCERKTKAHLMEFLRSRTSLRLEDEGQWFCALHEEPGAAETVAFRADMDALPLGDGTAHLCGHDGHSAVLAGLGLWLENRRLGRNVLLIFQHAEENGAGGKICRRALKEHGAGRVYAFHNIPGWPEGTVLLRHGTFACASRGMTLSFAGAPAHAAYPESGRNPGFAAARLICGLPEITGGGRFGGPAMVTLIGAKIGEKAFGCAAGDAQVWLTLRTRRENDMDRLIDLIEETARTQAARGGVETAVSFCDVFPATVNGGAGTDRLERICREAGLKTAEVPEPFRWSEDFGYYGGDAEAVMAGIGDGADWPQLHTEGYTFNDRILPAALRMFRALAEFG